jgi:chromosome segregation ATPase
MPDLGQIALLITAATGFISGLAGWLSSRRSARKVDVEALTTTVEALAAENKRLRECQEERGRENEDLHKQIRLLRERQDGLVAENVDLRGRIRNLRERQDILEQENEALRAENLVLRDRVQQLEEKLTTHGLGREFN